jgi:hypothetical protein
LVNAATPVGTAGVKQYHLFDSTMVFVLDDEPKPVPPPNVTQAIRRSIFQPLQQARYQFHINPAWGRRNGRYPRFSFIGTIADTGMNEAKLNRANSKSGQSRGLFGVMGQRPRPRFTKVLSNPRNDTTPDTYGPGGGYGE